MVHCRKTSCLIYISYLQYVANYRKPYSIIRTKYQHLNASRLLLQLSLSKPLKPGVKSRMKMKLEQRRQAMLQLYLSNQQVHCLLICGLFERFGNVWISRNQVALCLILSYTHISRDRNYLAFDSTMSFHNKLWLRGGRVWQSYGIFIYVYAINNRIKSWIFMVFNLHSLLLHWIFVSYWFCVLQPNTRLDYDRISITAYRFVLT